MPYDTIHILLLDGKVLRVELKSLKVKPLLKLLKTYLHLKYYETIGLSYKDSRGTDQWLDESKSISDHDIVPFDQALPLVFKIRFIPHHVCQDENHVHQLFLLGCRLLRQDWFLTQNEIHSQLVALYILSEYGGSLSDSDIHSTVIKCYLSMVDPFTNDNYFDTILTAYKRYRHKYKSAAEYLLKFLQLMMQFPIFNSKLFVISNSKGEKFIMGVSSIQITIFHLHQFQEPLKKISYKGVESVNHRDIKIMITLKDGKNNQRSILENEMVTYYALSSHQSDCIYSEIQACLEKHKTSTEPITINQLIKDANFKERFNRWLSTGGSHQGYSDHISDSINMHVMEIDEKDHIYNEQQFGEMNLYDNDIYYILSQVTNNTYDLNPKPLPDFDQLLTELERLKYILNEKMEDLLKNCNFEKELTGSMPAEHSKLFSSNIPKFTRNNNFYTTGRQSHKGCAAEIKNKSLNGNSLYPSSRAMSRDNLSYHSSSTMNSSLSPSVSVGLMKTSHSVTDLRHLNSSPKSFDECSNYSPGRRGTSPHCSKTSHLPFAKPGNPPVFERSKRSGSSATHQPYQYNNKKLVSQAPQFKKPLNSKD